MGKKLFSLEICVNVIDLLVIGRFVSSKILISVRPNQTCVAYLENENLIDFQIEKKISPTLVGSIFKGKVMRVLPGMQAAFVDIGLDRAAFLYVSDVRVDESTVKQIQIPGDMDHGQEEDNFSEGSAMNPIEDMKDESHKIPIQDLIWEGQHIMCQVAKDPMGTKGARITMHISLAGRSLVYMPTVPHFGVSKKIENESEKKRLFQVIEKMKPKGGVIVRTVGEGMSAEALKFDLDYLNRIWKEIQKGFDKRKTHGLIHREPGLELRVLRDFLNESVDEVFIDSKKSYKKIQTFVAQFIPKYKNKLKFYSKPVPLFDQHNIDLEISRSLDRKIWLKSGGYLVFDEAEALTVVDVNTGKFVGKKDIDDTILQTNLEAVKEIAHQLRIRNCGGIIIIDLIDMSNLIHREQVMKLFLGELKLDRAKTTVAEISELGLVEMTRKRIRPSLISSLCEPCHYCEGTGYMKRPMTVANEIFRSLERLQSSIDKEKAVAVRCHSDVADWVYEEEAENLDFIEKTIGTSVTFKIEPHFHREEYALDLGSGSQSSSQ